MKHIILITAYNQIDNLLNQLSIYDRDKSFFVYVHWDRRTITQEIVKAILLHSSVRKLFSQYDIHWGGRNLLSSMLFLCRKALEDFETKSNEAVFFHLISGSDALIRTTNEMKNFFIRHQSEGFMEFFSIPTTRWYQGGLERLIWCHPLDRLNIHDSKQYQIYQRYLNLQRHRGQQRQLPAIKLYGGSCWWSIPIDMAKYWAEHFNDDNLFDRLKDTYCPEEIHIHTILLNSSYKNYIQNNSLRYICWDYGARGTPAILENFDLPFINQSRNIWARKMPNIKNGSLQLYFQWFDSLPTYCPTTDDNNDLSQLTSYILTHIETCPLLGLMDGKMGALVYLCCYAKVFDDSSILCRASTMIDDIIKNSAEFHTSDFHNGIFGFVYSLAWLCENELLQRKALYLSFIEKFDRKVQEAYKDENLKNYFQDSFWQNYHQLHIYARLRKLFCPDTLNHSSVSSIDALLKRAGRTSYKPSIGMAGVSGYGFSKLRNFFNIIPPFIV